LVFSLADGIPCGRIFEAHCGEDIPCSDLLNLLPFIRMHFEKAANPFPFPFRGIKDRIPRFERSGIDSKEGQLSRVGVIHDFESQCGERVSVVGRKRELLSLEVNALHWRDI
jgi:hypothetical protein